MYTMTSAPSACLGDRVTRHRVIDDVVSIAVDDAPVRWARIALACSSIPAIVTVCGPQRIHRQCYTDYTELVSECYYANTSYITKPLINYNTSARNPGVYSDGIMREGGGGQGLLPEKTVLVYLVSPTSGNVILWPVLLRRGPSVTGGAGALTLRPIVRCTAVRGAWITVAVGPLASLMAPKHTENILQEPAACATARCRRRICPIGARRLRGALWMCIRLRN